MPRSLRFPPKKTSTFKPKRLKNERHTLSKLEGNYPGVRKLSEDSSLRPNVDFYRSIEWIQLSQEFRQSHPYCFRCGKQAIETRLEVDHIIELQDMATPELRLDPANLQCLCPSCHRIKTAQSKAKRKAKAIKSGNN